VVQVNAHRLGMGIYRQEQHGATGLYGQQQVLKFGPRHAVLKAAERCELIEHLHAHAGMMSQRDFGFLLCARRLIASMKPRCYRETLGS